MQEILVTWRVISDLGVTWDFEIQLTWNVFSFHIPT